MKQQEVCFMFRDVDERIRALQHLFNCFHPTRAERWQIMRLFWRTHYECFVTDRTDNIVILVVRVQGRACSIVVQSMDCVVGHEKT